MRPGRIFCDQSRALFSRLNRLKVQAMSHHPPALKKQRVSECLNIIFEDDCIVAFDKPFSMLSVPGREFKPLHRPRGEEWEDAVKKTCETEDIPLSSDSKQLLQKLVKQQGIPRKKDKFVRFINRTLKVDDKKILEEIWTAVTKVDEEMHRIAYEDIPSHLVSAADMVSKHCGHKIYHIHRLDMETSGILLFAKNEAICAEMSRQFRDREVHKEYIAKVAHGFDDTTKEKETTIDVPMRADLTRRPMQIVDFEEGKACTTIMKIMQNASTSNTDNTDSNDNKDAASTVKLMPVTGRSHQLRVHMAHIGHPILGDTIYAPPEVVSMSPRLCLHAHTIRFQHPTLKNEMILESKTCDFL